VKRLFAVTVLVAVGSVLFYEGFPQGPLLMSVGVATLLAGIVVAYRYWLKTSKNEAE